MLAVSGVRACPVCLFCQSLSRLAVPVVFFESIVPAMTAVSFEPNRQCALALENEKADILNGENEADCKGLQ